MSLLERVIQVGVDGAVQQGDAAVLGLLRQQPRLPGSAFLTPIGGLLAAESGFPQSAPEIVRRLTAQYGPGSVTRLRAADQRIALAVQAAADVRKLLRKALASRPLATHEVAHLQLDRAIEEHELDYHDILTALAVGDDAHPGGRLDDTEPAVSSLATLADVVWDQAYDSPGLRVNALVAAADQAQQEADDAVDAGAQLVTAVVAEDDSGDEISLSAALAPLAGTPDRQVAIAQARGCGHATAVVQVSGGPALFYTYALSDDLTYADMRAPNPIGATVLKRSGTVEVVALTTKDGHVLTTDPDGRYFVPLALPHRAPFLSSAFPDNDPTPFLQGDLALAEAEDGGFAAYRGKVFQPDTTVSAIFGQAALDYTIARLAQAERALLAQHRRFAPPDRMPHVSPEAGAALKAATAELRQVMGDAAILAAQLTDRSPSWLERDRAARLTGRMGELILAEPMALFFVTSTLEPDATPTSAHFVDRLAQVMDGDAAIQAAAETATRIDHVDLVRAHLIAHPGSARGLAAVYPDVISAFSDDQRFRLALVELGESLRVLSSLAGVAMVALVPLLLGMIFPPAGLIAGGLLAAVGLRDVVEGFEQAELMAAMVTLDVPDGFQLASVDDAASARWWAWVGLGLSVVDLLLLRADLGRILREAATGRRLVAATAAFHAVALQLAGPPPGVLRLGGAPGATVVRSAMAAAGGPGAVKVGVAALEAAELANKERLASAAFKELSSELRQSQRSLRALITGALDETARLAAAASLRKAAAALLSGGVAKKVKVAAVLKPAAKAAPLAAVKPRRLREFLVVGQSDAGVGWAFEQASAGRRATLVAATRTAEVDAFVAKSGTFVQGGILDLPPGYQCTVAREDLLQPGVIGDINAFLKARVDRLRQGGQWMVVTESPQFAADLAKAGPRPGIRTWTTEFATFRQGAPLTRYVVVIAKPRPTTMTALASLVRPATLTNARLAALLAEVTKPANLERLQRKLADVWHRGIIEAGQIAEWQLKNLTGNIAEILADSYEAQVLAARKAVPETANATLYTGVRRLDGTTGASKEFTDNLIAFERVGQAADGHLHVLDVFEVKAGPRGGQEAATQLFEWMEGELQVGDKIVVRKPGLPPKTFVYAPGTNQPNQVIRLARAQRHIIVAKGAEETGRGTADVVSAPVVRQPLSFGGSDINSAEIRHLARAIVESLPPPP